MFFVCFIKFSFSVWFMGLEIKHETLSVVLVFKQSRWSVCCVLKSVPAYSEQSRSLCSGTFYWSATAHWENAAIIIRIWNSPKWRFKSLFSIWSFFSPLFEFDPLYIYVMSILLAGQDECLAPPPCSPNVQLLTPIWEDLSEQWTRAGRYELFIVMRRTVKNNIYISTLDHVIYHSEWILLFIFKLAISRVLGLRFYQDSIFKNGSSDSHSADIFLS